MDHHVDFFFDLNMTDIYRAVLVIDDLLEGLRLFDLAAANVTLKLPLGIVHSHVPCQEGLGGKRLLALRAPVLVREVHQVPVLDHPGVVDKDEVALGALDIEGLLLVDKLDVVLEVNLTVGGVPTYVAHEFHVVGLLMAGTRM